MSRRGKEPPVRHTPLNTVYYHRSLTPQDVNGETPPVSIHPSTINIDYEDQGDDHAKELLDDPVFYKLPKYKEKKPYDTWGSWAANLGTADRAKPTKKTNGFILPRGSPGTRFPRPPRPNFFPGFYAPPQRPTPYGLGLNLNFETADLNIKKFLRETSDLIANDIIDVISKTGLDVIEPGLLGHRLIRHYPQAQKVISKLGKGLKNYITRWAHKRLLWNAKLGRVEVRFLVYAEKRTRDNRVGAEYSLKRSKRHCKDKDNNPATGTAALGEAYHPLKKNGKGLPSVSAVFAPVANDGAGSKDEDDRDGKYGHTVQENGDKTFFPTKDGVRILHRESGTILVRLWKKIFGGFLLRSVAHACWQFHYSGKQIAPKSTDKRGLKCSADDNLNANSDLQDVKEPFRTFEDFPDVWRADFDNMTDVSLSDDDEVQNSGVTPTVPEVDQNPNRCSNRLKAKINQTPPTDRHTGQPPTHKRNLEKDLKKMNEDLFAAALGIWKDNQNNPRATGCELNPANVYRIATFIENPALQYVFKKMPIRLQENPEQEKLLWANFKVHKAYLLETCRGDPEKLKWMEDWLSKLPQPFTMWMPQSRVCCAHRDFRDLRCGLCYIVPLPYPYHPDTTASSEMHLPAIRTVIPFEGGDVLALRSYLLEHEPVTEEYGRMCLVFFVHQDQFDWTARQIDEKWLLGHSDRDELIECSKLVGQWLEEQKK